MKDRATVLIAGIARNCGPAACASLDALEAACTGFAAVTSLVIESDSSDQTAEQLRKRPGAGRVISLGDLQAAMPERTARIAHCRNHIVQEVRALAENAPDFVLLADLDGVNHSVARAAIDSCFAVREPWDVLCANQPARYYDIWALRHPVWSPDDCWQAVEALSPVMGRRAAIRLCVRARQQVIRPDAPLLEVESAFGGLALYRREAFVQGHYVGIDQNGRPICEHVPFHADLRAAGKRIFINPRMLNAPQPEHLGGAATFLRRAKARLRRG